MLNQLVLEQTMKSLLNQGIKLRDLEKQYIEIALALSEDRRSLAARVLGIPPRTLYDKISKLRIKRFHSFEPMIKDIAMPATQRLGQMIRSARKKRSLEPKELAYALGYKDVSSISHIEMGRRIVPLALAPRISSLLGMSLEDLEQAIHLARTEKENFEKLK